MIILYEWRDLIENDDYLVALQALAILQLTFGTFGILRTIQLRYKNKVSADNITDDDIHAMNVETNVSLNQILHFVGGLCGVISLFHYRLTPSDFNNAEALYHTFQAFICFAIIPIFSGAFFIVIITLGWFGKCICFCCKGKCGLASVTIVVYVMVLIIIALTLAVDVAIVAIGWSYAFGDQKLN